MKSERSKNNKPIKRNEPTTHTVAVRLEDELVADVDEEAKRQGAATGMKLTRSNIVRLLLVEALKRRAELRTSSVVETFP